MARDIVDDRLVGAVHLQVLDRAGFDRDAAVAHVAYQAGTLGALMDGRFGGDATIGELLAHGDLGIGTVQHLAGELVIVDGHAHLVDADGVVAPVAPQTPTPFAVVCPFAPVASTDVAGPLGLAALHHVVAGLLSGAAPVVAIRADGDFRRLRLRSVHAQRPPYPTLVEVTRHQTEWEVSRARGTVVGFRFPDEVAGIEVPGHHLHFLSDDRSCGGHVLDLEMTAGRVAVDAGEGLHLELPDGVELGDPGIADRSAIRTAEGGGSAGAGAADG